MDHHGLLTLTRQLNITLTGINTVRSTGPPEWKWKVAPILFPESHCPFCLEVIRSEGVWFLKDDASGTRLLNRLVGAVFPSNTGGKVTLIQPSHPHDTGGGVLCLGRNVSGIALLASTPNINDSPMGRYYIPLWLKRYWNRHDCQDMRKYLRAGCEKGDINSSQTYIMELDSI
jgi:hypothetical protein